MHVFSPPENESRKAAKRKGSWAHQQTDKITPWTIVSLSVVEDVGESDSKLWKDRRVNVIQGSIAGRLENFPGSVETSSCLLNQKHQHLVHSSKEWKSTLSRSRSPTHYPLQKVDLWWSMWRQGVAWSMLAWRGWPKESNINCWKLRGSMSTAFAKSLEASQIYITSLPADVGLHHVTSCYIIATSVPLLLPQYYSIQLPSAIGLSLCQINIDKQEILPLKSPFIWSDGFSMLQPTPCNQVRIQNK